MSNVYFTADSHFGHSRIIQYCNRPFSNHEEMDEAILERFNSVIKKGDSLYHLGDVSWSTYPLDNFFGRLNTKQVHLIYGNHDKPKVCHHESIRSYDYIKNLHLDNLSVVLCHYAMRSWASRSHGGLHLYGHSHGKLPGLGRSMDVGVDTNNFYPYAWEEIRDSLTKIDWKPEEEA